MTRKTQLNSAELPALPPPARAQLGEVPSAHLLPCSYCEGMCGDALYVLGLGMPFHQHKRRLLNCMRAKADDSPTNFVNALGNTHRHTHTQTQNTVESIQLRCSCRSLGWNRPVLVCRAGIRNDHHRRWRYKHENSISSDDSHVPACRHHCPICHGLTSFHFRWATRGGIRRFPELPTIRRWHDARQLVQEGWASRAGCAILCGSRICSTLLSYPLHHGDPPISR